MIPRPPVAPAILLLLALTGAAGSAAGQDALRGKRLYYDAARVLGTGVSCVDCHGGFPGALHGIARAAGNPAAIEYALGAIPQMSRLRGQLAMQDLADLAAYLAAPAVPSPLVRLTTCGPAANRYTPERLEFRAASSVPSEIRVRNGGELPLRLLSAPVIAGEAAGAFSITRSDCEAGTVLAPNASCSVAIASGRATAGRARSARVSVAHDWIGGRATVALLLDTAAARSAGRPCD